MRTAVAALLMLSALAACGDDDAPTPTRTACQEVRAGIDAFNLGDYASTQAHFRDAVPLAEKEVAGGAVDGGFVDAVRYYAELAPADYAESSRSSRAFARNKRITLERCVPAVEEDQPPATTV